jgi:hypothetical protein
VSLDLHFEATLNHGIASKLSQGCLREFVDLCRVDILV